MVLSHPHVLRGYYHLCNDHNGFLYTALFSVLGVHVLCLALGWNVQDMWIYLGDDFRIQFPYFVRCVV